MIRKIKEVKYSDTIPVMSHTMATVYLSAGPVDIRIVAIEEDDGISLTIVEGA